MTIKEYIASGILESYVSGTLEEKDMRKVECMALVHDEIRAELEAIETLHEKLLLDLGEDVSDGLKEKIRASIRGAHPTDTPVIGMTPEARPESLEGPAEQTTVQNWKWATAAALIGCIAMASVVFGDYSKSSDLEASLLEKNEQTQELSERLAANERQMAEMNQELTALRSDVDVMNSSSYLAVILKGTENAPKSSGKVFWSPEDKEVYLSLEKFDALPSGMVYQLWALDEGVPVDAGTFGPESDGLVKMKDIASGQAFAVTIEKEGGAESPALETLQVMGEVPA